MLRYFNKAIASGLCLFMALACQSAFGAETEVEHTVSHPKTQANEQKSLTVKELDAAKRPRALQHADMAISHPGIYHRVLYSVGPNLTLDDGSVWRLTFASDSFTWSYGQAIVLSKWASHYALTNQATGKSATFDLCDVAGPFYRPLPTPSTLFILDINFGTSEIILNDYSRWKVQNAQTLSTWCVDDTVVLGDDGFLSFKPFMINHRTQNDAKVTQR